MMTSLRHEGSCDRADSATHLAPRGTEEVDQEQETEGMTAQFSVALGWLVVVSSVVHAQPSAAKAPKQSDPRWTSIARVFGQKGETHDGYFRVNFPRTDLHVRIGTDALEPGFELSSYVGFAPVGKSDVLAMGEIVLRADEVATTLAELRRQGVGTPALHNHLIGEDPRIMYIHVMTRGGAEAVATKLKAVFSKSATPLAAPADQPPAVDWSSIDAVLGKHAEAEGHVAEYVFPRNERLTVGSTHVKSTGMLETASEVVFQQLGPNRVACGGELFVLPGEIDAVGHALEEHGLHVTATHNHMVDETPRMYWMHWYGTGDGPSLARGVAAALAHMNGARKSVSEE
jgi:uncharacterized protein DUF1259